MVTLNARCHIWVVAALLWLLPLTQVLGGAEDERDWGESGPALQRLSHAQRQMASLLRQANQALTRGEAADGVARQFYADLAKLSLKAPMVELNRLKTRLTEVGLETAALGEKLGGGGTPVERALLVYRRDLTMDSIRAAVAEVARTHGTDVGSVYLAKIGKWAVQNPDMFTLAGDIDFSFMGARPDVLIALRDAFSRIITERSGGLDMVAIDSVATAHGFAEHMVYMGIQGRKFADDAMMGMNEGVEQIDFRDPDSVGTKRGRQLSGRQALIETVLEETGIRYREEGYEAKGRRLSDEIERTWSDRRNQTVEPFLSMEMARHLEADIIRNVDVFAAIDIIKKGAKYLRRSNDQTTGDLKIPAADAGWAKLVVEVDEKAKKATAEEMVKFIDAELRKLGIEGFEMKIVDGKATLQTKPGGAEAFLAEAKKMIWSNVSNGLDARITGLTDALNNRGRAAGPETLDDLRPERLADTIRMIEAGLDVMKHEHSEIPPDVKTKLSVLAKLIEGYAAPRGYALPKEELDKLRELLKEAGGNENTLLLKMGAVVGHIDKWLVKNYDAMTAKLPAARQLAYADAQIDALNSVMDVLDNSTLGALRDRGIVELELDPILSADGKSRRLAAVTFPRIAAINQRLNQSILGRIGNNTAFKTFNLYQESDAYYAALMQAGTPSEAFSNIATEIFRRRVPGGGAVEAIVMENYLRASIEVVYTIFPPVAIPEGLYGVGISLYESGKQAWWRSELEFLIDSLYDKARFEAVDGKPGTFRLKEVSYKRIFTRDDLEKGKDFILDPAVDQTLTKNLRDGDAFLTLMEELQKHGAAGDKVRASFKAQADKRWEELKHEFVLHLIDKLEKRYAAEIADVAGKIPDLFNELMDAAEKLEIKDRVLASMEVAWDSYSVKFRDYWIWLKNTARAGIWGGTLAETERNRAAREVMRYRDAYKSVLENREKLEAAVATYLAQAGLDGPNYSNVQHNQRLLTGITFLSGKPDEDAAVARQWGAVAGTIHQTVEGELTNIKGTYVPNARLDNDFDNRTLGAVFFEDIWVQALRFMKVPVVSAGSFGRAIERREEGRAALVKAFRTRYANASGTVSVRVLRLDNGKPGRGIVGADVTLKGGGGEVRLTHKGEGLYAASGLRPGSYAATVSAKGFKARDGSVEAKARVELPAPNDTSRIGEATVLMTYATASSELSVSIEVSPADGRIASSGSNSSASLKANVVTRPDSGKLRFQWAAGDKVLDQGDGKSATTFRGEGYGGKEVTVSVVVIDEKGREGTASVVVAVAPGEDITVVIAPHRGEIGRNEDETVEVSAPVGDDVKYQWTISEDGGHPRPWDGIRKYLVNGANHAGKKLTLTVRATAGDGRTGSATTSLRVKDEDVEKKDDGAAKPAEPTKKLPRRGAGGSVSGMFPGEPFNGMQISYSASGCGFPTMKDEPGFGTYRNYEGRLGNGTMTVSGTARMGGGFGADLVVSVTAGGKTAEHKAYIKSGWPGFNSESFNLSVPIPDDATTGGFSIMMDGHYSMGGGWRGLGVSGSCSADGPEGDAPKGTEDLDVDLKDQKDPVPVGHKVELTAHTKGGRFPYEYVWTGVDGKDDKATFSSKKPGDFTVTVKVSDTDGKSADDTTQIKVAPLKFELVGVPTKPIYGSSAKLTARAVGPAPQGAKLRYLWQSSEKGVELSPTESENGETTVTFGRLSSVKLWAQVVDADTGTAMGETPQVATTVAAPAFSVRFTPPAGQGRIGQEVKAQIVANPEVPAKLIDYRWLEPATSNRREATENASEIGFVPKDAKPVVLKALARVPFHGDELGTIEASYTGAPYKVQVSVEERGPKPVTWDPVKGGLVPVPKGTYAADEQVGLRAALEGEPKPAEVRWRWTVNDGTTIGNPISQTPTVSRHESGAITATVEALDRDGNVLGSGTTSLSVTVSADAVGNAKAKAEAAKLVGEAKAAWAGKDPSKALALIEKAQKLDPKDAEIGRLVNEYRDGKARFDRAATLREEGGRLQNAKKLAEALDRFKQAQALWPDPKLAEHIAKVEAALAKEREAEAKAKALREEATRLAQDGKLDEAIAKVEESLRVRTTPEAEQQLRDLKAARDRKKSEEAQKQARAKALRDEGAALQAKGDLAGALAKFKEAQQLLPDPKLAEHIAKVEAALKERQALIDQAEALRRNPQAIGCSKGLGDATALADRLQKVDAGKAAALRKDIATVAMATASGLVGNQLDFAKGIPCLEVAQKLDPGNAQVGQELERARQIQAGWRELQTLPTRMDAAAAAGRILEADQIRSRAPELARGIDQAPPVRDLLASLVAKWDRAMAVYRAHRDSLMAELQAMLDGRRYQELIARGDAELAREWYPGDAQRIRELQSHAREKMAYEASQKAPPQSPTAPAATPGGTAPTATAKGAVPGKATDAATSAGSGCGSLQRTDVTRRTWRFGRSNDTVVAESVRLTEAGRMEGYYHPNEHAWSLENGVLVFRNPGNEAITRFTQCTTRDGRLVLRGPYALDKSFEHILTEIAVDASPTAHPATTGTPGGLQGSTVTGAGVTSGVPTGSTAAGAASAGGGSQVGAGSIRIEACVDGSDWLRIENGRLVHEHRAFAQIGAHPDCPASHAVGGGGLLVNGQRVSLGQLPYGVGIANLGSFELEKGRGSARLDGSKGLLLDDDGPGGPSIYVVRLYGGATAAPPAATPPKPPAPKRAQIGNIGGVTNGPTAPTTFTFSEPVRLVWLQTYHWNGARGATPGRIGLRHQDGTVYGPWPTRGLPGQGGVPNAYWRAEPGVVLKPGTYTVSDSDPSTWATNAQAGNKGFADLEVVPVTDATATTPPANVAAPAPVGAAAPTTTPATAAPASATILTGRWQASCDGNDEVYPVTMRQDGNRLQVVVEGQAQYQGTFDGHRLKGTSADGLDSFDGTAVSPIELRLDWEGRTSADSPVYHNACTLRRDGPPPVGATTPASAPPKTVPVAPPAASTAPPANSATPPPKASATTPKGGTVPCKRDGRNPFEEDLCIEVDKMVPVAPR